MRVERCDLSLLFVYELFKRASHHPAILLNPPSLTPYPPHHHHPTPLDAARAAQARDLSEKNKRLGLYAISIVIAVTGICYASVPLYKVFCQATGFGGTTKRVDSLEAVVGTAPADKVRPIKIVFNADVSDTTPWKFYPTQPDILVVPGETALAFFTVKNKTDKAVIGVATYNVFPPKAGLYFNKIQCFCFDEQRLKPREEVDMPVFFFVDPEMLNDPSMENVHEITLSYTFFKTDEENEEEVQELLRKNVNYPGSVGGGHGKVRAAATVSA